MLEKLKILDGSILKLIAVVSMLIDHAALVLLSDKTFAIEPFLSFGGRHITLYYILRKLGRLAFPLFCFLIAEGFIHTKNLKKYALNLFVFAMISEIPYNLMLSGKLIYMAQQNIYFTLLLGVAAVWVAENINESWQKFLLLALIIAVAIVLRVDYGFRGVLLILLLYILRNNKILQTFLSLPMLSGGFAAWFAFIPINMYNGKRGFIKGGFLKYLFYLFYPLHILLLILIKKLI